GSTLLRTRSAATASSVVPWDTIAAGDAHAAVISSVTVAVDGRAYVLLASSTSNDSEEFPTYSPLYEVSTGYWRQQACTALPVGSTNCGELVADPVSATTLYATAGSRVFRLVLTGGAWVWADITGGLPGHPITRLQAINAGTAAAPHVILRACASATCIWERDAADVPDDRPVLYVRDNVLDPGYITPTPEDVPNPFRPAEHVWHYQSPDIVVDAEQDNR